MAVCNPGGKWEVGPVTECRQAPAPPAAAGKAFIYGYRKGHNTGQLLICNTNGTSITVSSTLLTARGLSRLQVQPQAGRNLTAADSIRPGLLIVGP